MSAVSFHGVSKRYANGFQAVTDLDLEVGDGELLVLVGPSGCGKTTTLRMLAGLEDVTAGTIEIGAKAVNDVAARERDIAMVFQSYALYPHLTVAGNLGYPLRLAGMPKAERVRRVVAVAKQLRIESLLDRKPRQLSGGQRQRVAMGRAMVRQPRVFLMDEPLSNLDAKLRVAMRAEVSELQQSLGATMFYVTHDQVEAMTMGDRVAIMDRGLLQQVATPDELYHHPANLFVAGFIGSPPMNLFRAGSADLAFAGLDVNSLDVDAGPLPALGDQVVIGARPEHVVVGAAGSGLPGVVRLVEILGSEQVVHIEVAGIEHVDVAGTERDELTGRRMLALVRDDRPRLRQGEAIGLRIPAKCLHFFDADTGDALTRDRALAG